MSLSIKSFMCGSKINLELCAISFVVIFGCGIIQARSGLRFWRGAEVDKVQNPKQLYAISLEKVLKIVAGAPQAKITIFAKFLAP